MEFHLLELINQIGSPAGAGRIFIRENGDFPCGDAWVST
jgi:hypothetical protein